MSGIFTGIGIFICGIYYIANPKAYVDTKNSNNIKKGRPELTDKEIKKYTRSARSLGVLLLLGGLIVGGISLAQFFGIV